MTPTVPGPEKGSIQTDFHHAWRRVRRFCRFAGRVSPCIGIYFLPVKYGRNPIELKKGMFAIQCDNIDLVADALGAIRAKVLQGDMDEQLSKASNEIRAKFEAKG